MLVPWLGASIVDFPPFVRKFRLYIDTLRSYKGYSYKGYLVEYLGTRQIGISALRQRRDRMDSGKDSKMQKLELQCATIKVADNMDLCGRAAADDTLVFHRD